MRAKSNLEDRNYQKEKIKVQPERDYFTRPLCRHGTKCWSYNAGSCRYSHRVSHPGNHHSEYSRQVNKQDPANVYRAFKSKKPCRDGNYCRRLSCNFSHKYDNPREMETHMMPLTSQVQDTRAMPQRSDCWNCKQIGHAGSDCPKIQCYKCGNIGHISPACTRSKRLSDEPGPSRASPEHVKVERSREPSRSPPMTSPGRLKYFAPNRHNDDPKISVTTGNEHRVEGSGSEARGSHKLTSVGVLTSTSQTSPACSLPSMGS